jgi:hypothetical protein
MSDYVPSPPPNNPALLPEYLYRELNRIAQRDPGKQLYAPTWTATSDPAIGDGSIDGEYIKWGSLVLAKAHIVMGSTTTYGSGVWNIGLPFPAASAFMHIGSARVFQSGVIIRSGNSISVAGTAKCTVEIDSTGNGISSTVPHTWSANDAVTISLPYITD